MTNGHRRPRRLALAALGAAAIIGLVATGPVAAETDARTTDRARVAAEVADARPVDERPERPTRDLEVLRLACGIADDDQADDATRVHIGCRWRAATSERAAGYQLWRIVDRGERELVARGGLDLLGARDVVAADSHLVRYAVIAVDENGRRVGQSRVERVVITELDDHDRRLADRAKARTISSR